MFFFARFSFQHYPMETSLYICLCGRVVLQNSQYFFTLMDRMASEFQCDVSTLGPVYNEFGYYEHPAITSRFFSLN